jgi:ABC-type nickel/cobalt efflux system permease component RcnA
MKLKPTTRQFLSSAGVAALVLAVMIFRAFARVDHATGSSPQLSEWLMEAAMFGVILALGVSIAWFKLLRDRKERRNRRPPLDLS